MSSLKFGTSGLRGLVVDLDGPAAEDWTKAFLRHLERSGQVGIRSLMIGQDLRSSSPSIAMRVATAAEASGWTPVDLGALPTPALAMASMAARASAVMITGSHIPDDRNGLKFYAPKGEIDKADEIGIREACGEIQSLLSAEPDGQTGLTLSGDAAIEAYAARYADFFGNTLSGLRIGVYQQSSVARDILVDVLTRLGAEVTPLAHASSFIPVDTEAHRDEDVALIRGWSKGHPFDAIVSTDGDADRPLVADETGAILRGDVLGLLVAKHLGLRTIVTPVTSASAIEGSGIAESVIRTKVGSPFVIAGMIEALNAEKDGVVGFEANGGVLLGSPVEIEGRTLQPLMTRDALLPILCALAEAAKRAVPLSDVVTALSAGFTAASRLQKVPAEESAPFLERLAGDPNYRRELFSEIGSVGDFDQLDGVRTLIEGGISVHFRASGNAPELRCYVEAPTQQQADDVLKTGLSLAEGEIGRNGTA